MKTVLRQKWFGQLLVLLPGAILPLIYSHELGDPVLAPRFGFFGLLTLISLLVVLRSNKLTLPGNRLFLALFTVLSALGIISLWGSTNLSEGFNQLSKYILAVIYAATLFSLLCNQQLSIKSIAFSVSLLGLILVVTGCYQVIEYYLHYGVLPFDQKEISAGMANKNLYGSALAICLPSFICCFAWLPKKLRLIPVIPTVLTVVILIIIQPKSCLFFLFIFCISMLYWFAFRFMNVRLGFRKRKSLIIGSSVFLFVAIASVFLLNNRIQKEVKSLNYTIGELNNDKPFRYERASTDTRLALYYYTLDIIKDKPISGIGPGNWRVCFPCYGLKKFNGRVKEAKLIFQRAHSDILQFIAEFGLPAFLIVFIFWLGILIHLIEQIVKSKSRNDWLLATTLFTFFIAYLPVLLFDFSMERPAHLMVMFTYVAISYFMIRKKVITGKARIVNFFFYTGLATVIVFMWLDFQWIKGEYYSRKLVDANFHQTIRYENKASSFAYTINPLSIPVKWYSGVAHYARGEYEQALPEFQEAYQNNPCQIHVINNLASTYVQIGDQQNAITNYQKALQISPIFEESLINLSAVYFNMGNTTEAFNTITRCPLDATHQNYLLFFNTILKAYAGEITNNKMQFTDNKIRELYIHSLNHNIPFEDLVKEEARGH